MHWHFESVELPEYCAQRGTVFCHMVICKHCFRLVETGAMNLHDHLRQCAPYREKIVIDMSLEATRRAMNKFFKTGKF